MFVEGHDELWQNFIVDHAFGEFLVHVSQAAEGEGGALGDGRDVVEEEGAEETHDSG